MTAVYPDFLRGDERPMYLNDYLSGEELDAIIAHALDEDTGHGDVTSEVLLPRDLSGRAALLVKERGVLAGIGVAERIFHRVEPALKVEVLIQDGANVKPGDIAGTVSGRVVSILKAERVVLNFLQRLSGIASATARYVAETRGTDAKIVDTRKTTPGLRPLEKYAVRVGGGTNHRRHLGDAVLIKDNHIAALRATGLNLREIITKARQNAPEVMTIEVEVTGLQEARDALQAAPDIIMLDNMGIDEMKQAVALVRGRVRLEASGGITLENVRQVALTGVDMISVGALTHSYRALDISLEFETSFLKGLLS
jgi:nicotinate-nucleotide pyrophosphorylase (carboxylating)